MERAFGIAIDIDTGVPSSNPTITVFNTSTLNLANVFQDNLGTPLANPFTGAANGYWYFYAANGGYDVQIEKALTTTYTLGDYNLADTQTFNGQSGDTQTFVTDEVGTNFTISSSSDIHTFSLPTASATARGVVSTGAQDFAGPKTFLTPIAVGSGGTGLNATPTNGQLLIGNGTNFTLSSLTGTANQIISTPGVGSITLSTPQNIHTAATPTFAGATLSGLTPNELVIAGGGGLLGTAGPATNGQLLIGATGTSPSWASLVAGANISIVAGPSSLTISGTGGVSSLNGLTASAQTFVVTTTGSDFTITSAASAHTFALPDAGTAVRGVVTTGAQNFSGTKQFNSPPTFNPGGSSGTASQPAAIYYRDATTRTTLAAATPTDFGTKSVDANILDIDGRTLRCTWFGEFAATGNAKTPTFSVNGTAVATKSGGYNYSDGQWICQMLIERSSSTNVRVSTNIFTSGTDVNTTNFGAVSPEQTYFDTLAVSDLAANAFIVKLNVTDATTAGGTTQHLFLIEVL